MSVSGIGSGLISMQDLCAVVKVVVHESMLEQKRRISPWVPPASNKTYAPCPATSFQTLFVAGGTSRYIRSQHLKEIGKLFPRFVVSTIKGAG